MVVKCVHAYIFLLQEQLVKSGLLWEDPAVKLSALREGKGVNTTEESRWHKIRISAGMQFTEYRYK